MSTVAQARDPVQVALYDRPFLNRKYYPLASFLIVEEYSTEMRNRIIDWVGDGGLLESLIVDGTLEREHLAPAQLALDDGRAWERQFRLLPFGPDRQPYRAEIPEPDPGSEEEENGPTADPFGDPVYYEHGEPAPMPVIDRPEGPETEDEDTVDYVPDPRDSVTLDVEPFHPGPEPDAGIDYPAHGFDPAAIQQLRDWYAANDYGRWLESQGGERI
jgi:hypothetical protein